MVYMDQPLLSGASALNTAAAVTLDGNVNNAVVFVKGGAGITAGAVTIEEADDVNYAGTWSSIQVVTPTASTTTAVHLAGTYKAIRTRVSTGFTGGVVDTRIVAADSGL